MSKQKIHSPTILNQDSMSTWHLNWVKHSRKYNHPEGKMRSPRIRPRKAIVQYVGNGNFCVHPRFHPTDVGWYLGLTPKFHVYTNLIGNSRVHPRFHPTDIGCNLGWTRKSRVYEFDWKFPCSSPIPPYLRRVKSRMNTEISKFQRSSQIPPYWCRVKSGMNTGITNLLYNVAR